MFFVELNPLPDVGGFVLSQHNRTEEEPLSALEESNNLFMQRAPPPPMH